MKRNRLQPVTGKRFWVSKSWTQWSRSPLPIHGYMMVSKFGISFLRGWFWGSMLNFMGVLVSKFCWSSLNVPLPIWRELIDSHAKFAAQFLLEVLRWWVRMHATHQAASRFCESYARSTWFYVKLLDWWTETTTGINDYIILENAHNTHLGCRNVNVNSQQLANNNMKCILLYTHSN